MIIFQSIISLLFFCSKTLKNGDLISTFSHIVLSFTHQGEMNTTDIPISEQNLINGSGVIYIFGGCHNADFDPNHWNLLNNMHILDKIQTRGCKLNYVLHVTSFIFLLKFY